MMILTWLWFGTIALISIFWYRRIGKYIIRDFFKSNNHRLDGGKLE